MSTTNSDSDKLLFKTTEFYIFQDRYRRLRMRIATGDIQTPAYVLSEDDILKLTDVMNCVIERYALSVISAKLDTESKANAEGT